MELAYIVYTFIFAFTLLFAFMGVNAGRTRNMVVERYKVWSYWGIAIVFYTLLVGLRENVGIDYTSYKNVFDELMQVGLSYRQQDIIYYLFLPAVENIHYNLFIAFLAFITIFFIFKNFEDQPQILVLYLFFYFTFLIFFLTLNIMRQNAACFVAFFAVKCFKEKEYGRFIAYYSLAFILHASVLFLLPFVFLFKYDFFKFRWLQYVLLLTTFLGSNILFSYIEPKLGLLSALDIGQYNFYLENYEYLVERGLEMKNSSGGTGLFKYLTLSLDCLAIFYSTKLKRSFSHYHFTLFYNFFIIGAILSNIASFHETADRLVYYFLFYRIYIYAVLFYYIYYKTEKLPLLKLLCICIMLIGVVVFYFNIHRGNMDIAPFQFIN